ncbi:MAG: SMP-30/gluconolactonase/LRE family protein [Methanospirillum sp.]
MNRDPCNQWRIRALSRTAIVLLAACLLTTLTVASSAADTNPTAGKQVASIKHRNLTDAELKLSTDLLELTNESYLLPGMTQQDITHHLILQHAYQSAGRNVRVVNASAPAEVVYVYVRLSEGTPLSIVDPYAWRVTDRGEEWRSVAAWVEVSRLLALAADPGVTGIRTIDPPITRSGSVTAESDQILLAKQLRDRYGLAGAGVKIGVISDGVDSWEWARDSGDLPADLTILNNRIHGSEGVAMLEIVHDIAPAAKLYFHDAGGNVFAFKAAVDALVAAGCTVIVDDIGLYDSPFFEDSPLETHLQLLSLTKNLLYFSAAGNEADAHYQGVWKATLDGYHDFSNGTTGTTDLYVSIGSGGSFDAIFEWDDPWGGSANDYDIFLWDTRTGRVLAHSDQLQDGDDEPWEKISYSNNGGSTIDAAISVSKASTAADRTLEISIGRRYNTTVSATNIVPSDSIWGHQTSPGVVTVGAIRATDPGWDTIEPFSSRGPCTIRYPSPTQRMKPDITGIDGVRVTGAGNFHSPFYGTSASAPGVAAIAALVWSGVPTKNADEVRNALLSSCVDLGPPDFDTAFGYGRANAIAFAQALGIATGPTVTSITPSTAPPGSTVAITSLAGAGFQPGATVRLRRAGYADIAGTSVVVLSATKIACTFVLPSNAAKGNWDVVVTNPDDQSLTLETGFAIAAAETPTPTPTPTRTPESPEKYQFVTKWGSAGEVTWLSPLNGIAVDGSGNVYATEDSSVLKFASDGTFVTSWGGFENSTLILRYAAGIAVDRAGDILVADSNNNRIMKYRPDGTFLKQWGVAGSGNGQFKSPRGVAVDSAGLIYVTDSENHRVQTFSPEGIFVATWGSWGSQPGQLNVPWGIAIDAADNVYVAEYENHRIQKLTKSGASLATWGRDGGYAYQGQGDGEFSHPTGVAVDGEGIVYVADRDNQRIQMFTSGGVFIAKWGGDGPGLGGSGSAGGQFYGPTGVAVDGAGAVYVSELDNMRIQKLTSKGVFLAEWTNTGSRNGLFYENVDVAVDSAGDIYVGDSGNNRVQKFSSTGAYLGQSRRIGISKALAVSADGNVQVSEGIYITTMSPSLDVISRWDYRNTLGMMESPDGIAFDRLGDLYLLNDDGIYKLTANHDLLAHWSSHGVGDGQVYSPNGIAVDSAGNIYTVEQDSPRIPGLAHNRVQKFSPNGTYVTQWSTAGPSMGDLYLPKGIAVDDADDVYVADTFNHRIVKFTSNGTFVTTWGSHGSGDGQFQYPEGIAVDAADNVYVADSGNNRTQKFAPVHAGATLVPGGVGAPGDTNGDGLCDDVNGNGRKDFADVVLYFNQMTWIAANEPVAMFDYNENGRIDFADVVWLFNNL